MFADLHHLHQFISLDQGGSVSAVSTVSGTTPGTSSIYFGGMISACSLAVYSNRYLNVVHVLEYIINVKL
jgi:hypothetical protein